MAITATRRTPGVYITELAAFPPSIVGVQTAVPAFIGYTEKAEMAVSRFSLNRSKSGRWPITRQFLEERTRPYTRLSQ